VPPHPIAVNARHPNQQIKAKSRRKIVWETIGCLALFRVAKQRAAEQKARRSALQKKGRLIRSAKGYTVWNPGRAGESSYFKHIKNAPSRGLRPREAQLIARLRGVARTLAENYSSIATVSPPARVPAAYQISNDVDSLTYRTEPSTKQLFTPPEW